MKIIKPSYEILHPLPQDSLLSRIERAGRTCYKSEHRITLDSAEKFVRGILKSGHDSVLEHESISVRIVCDRGVSHELVRHRLASYSQESTRYVNYTGQMQFIRPVWFDKCDVKSIENWQSAMRCCERHYNLLIADGWKPEQARIVLPNSVKTELVMTANIREWRHIFRLRSSAVNKASHPQMREITDMMLTEFTERWPVLFGDIGK